MPSETLPTTPVLTVHGNFYELPRYSMLTQPRERCRRLYTLLGLTLVNLREEVRFFRDTLSCGASGDLFLCDVLFAYAPPEQPDEIRRKDPALTNPVRESHKAWRGGPLPPLPSRPGRHRVFDRAGHQSPGPRQKLRPGLHRNGQDAGPGCPIGASA